MEACGWSYWWTQGEIFRSVFENHRTTVRACNGPGKALCINTPIPTPTGWAKMGELKAGDFVFSEDGKPCKILKTIPVHKKKTFRVFFDDNSFLDASDDHLWAVILANEKHKAQSKTKYCGRSKIEDWREYWSLGINLRTKDIVSQNLKTDNYGRKFSIPTTKNIEGKKINIPAYTFGFWLGDGTGSMSAITLGDQDAEEVIKNIENEKITISKRKQKYSYGLIGGFLDFLKKNNLLKNKHIPQKFLRADFDTKLEILRGIIDSDGHAAGKGEYEIMMMDKKLMDGIYELIVSFGWKARISKKKTKYLGKRWKDGWRIRFSPDCEVSRIKRKTAKIHKAQRSRKTIRTIKEIKPLGVRNVCCILVDSPRSLFLAGRAMIPTHNTYVAARIALAWLFVYGQSEGITAFFTTAPTFRQVKTTLWKEIMLATRNSEIDLGGELLQTEIKIAPEVYGMGFSSREPDSIAGVHAENLLMIVDEASGVSPENLEAIEGMLTGKNNRLLMLGNPIRAQGTFHDSFSSEMYTKFVISAFDTPNFTENKIRKVEDLENMTLEEVEALPLVSTSLVTPKWVWDKIHVWGVESAPFQSRVLARFVEDSEDSLVTLVDVHSAIGNEKFYCQKYDQDHPYLYIGADIARFGKDKTVIYVLRGKKVEECVSYDGKDTGFTIGEIQRLCEKYKSVLAVGIDDTGVGGGVTDGLRGFQTSLGVEPGIVGLNFGSKARDFEKFANKKAEIMWYMRGLFEDGEVGILEDGNIVGDLTSVRYGYTNDQKIMIEQKKELRKRGIPSPDFADALGIALWIAQEYSRARSFTLSRAKSNARLTSRNTQN